MLAGVTTSVPTSTPRLVTVPEVKSVIERVEVFDTLNESVVLCPALMVVADAE